MSDQQSNNLPQDEINFEKIFKLVWRNLWLFIICGVLAMGAAFIYNKYAVPTYKVNASILIKEDESSPFTKGMNDLFTGNLFGGNQNLQNELLILQSRPIIEQMVNNLDMEVAYYEYHDFQYHDAYGRSPFKIILIKDHVQLVGAKIDLFFRPDGSFTLEVQKQNAITYNYIADNKTAELEDYSISMKGNLGEIIETAAFKFIVELTDETIFNSDEEQQFAFSLRTNKALSTYFENALKFSIADKQATVINIELETTSVQRGEDVVNELIRVYSKNNLDEKNHIANMTIDYIEAQLQEVSESLVLTEDSLQQFLSENQLMDVETQAAGYSEQLMVLQNQLAELITQKRYFTYVSDYLKENEEEAQIIAPASMGVQDPLLNKLIMDLSEAQSRRSNLIQNKQERNPIVQRLTIQIDNLKSVVAENITSAQNSNNIRISELQKRIDKLENEISKLPKTQLQLGGIERNYQLNDAIYNYLLQKHAEAKITKASNLPDNAVVEPASMVGTTPVAPNKKMVYIMGFVLGVGLPFGFLLLLMQLKTKVELRDDLEKITNAPILGSVLHSRKKAHNVFAGSGQSNMAESYRSLRTNINFYLKNKNTKCILVSSSITGEGKSFNSVNIAASYAALGNRTILLNSDMRKATPLFEPADANVGLSTFLNGDTDWQKIIQNADMENLYYIPSGPIPPNPMELIASTKTDELFARLKDNFDCIVIDSTPMAQVTDAFNLVKFADVCLMVTRYKYTPKKVLRLVLKDLKQKQIENVGLLLNDNRIAGEQYGYGYGYYKK